MRIISGSAGGIQLFTPKSNAVRPAADRTRQAIFSALGELIPEATVLDLFAGTGSIGLEALSRGARQCVFVEKNKPSLALLQKNLDHTKVAGGEILAMDAIGALDRFVHLKREFDLIFADPPFWKERDVKHNLLSNPDQRKFTNELLKSAALLSILKPKGLFILDSYDQEKVEVPKTWKVVRDQIYGQVRVQFLIKSEEAEKGEELKT
ncbi:MAG: 16S rRNA (guanine(966)-N(2))-methyltransferase RsmD [Verrucomicrobiota bacterium]|nr:16S rRNA (guanine(966)-N(2))-methyltransferase RsmD [Verrucomicrobiota bacterium]